MPVLSPQENALIPFVDELPSAFADRLGAFYTSKVNIEHKKNLGQYFTPLPISKFIAEFAGSNSHVVKILDPGCGVGILSIALAEELVSVYPQVKSIELVAFETDVELLPFAEAGFDYLREWLSLKGIELNFFLCKNDFILHNSNALSIKGQIKEQYDIIVSNPPYFKLPKDDPRSIAAQEVIYGQTNIYSIFLLIAAKLLKPGAKLIFITPRSFCSGNYFRMFREQFFSLVDIKNIHVFESRKTTFKRDKVLQETLIIAATAKLKVSNNQLDLPFDQVSRESVIVSTSDGVSDLSERTWRFYSSDSLIDKDSHQKTLHLPINNDDDEVINIFRSWNETLHSLGWEVSTGKIVDFRCEDFVISKPIKGTVPLFWLHNIQYMHYVWPSQKGLKGKTKPQYFLSNDKSNKLLVPNANYVLLRRFSSKDDNRKLIASPYLKDYLTAFGQIGIENHLNYIYRKSGSLEKNEVFGLAALLNSTIFDRYFRTFNGNINVSATELRDIRLPKIQTIRNIGNDVIKKGEVTQVGVDAIISKHLGI